MKKVLEEYVQCRTMQRKVTVTLG